MILISFLNFQAIAQRLCRPQKNTIRKHASVSNHILLLQQDKPEDMSSSCTEEGILIIITNVFTTYFNHDKMSNNNSNNLQKQPQEVFYKKDGLKNFAKLTGKYLRQSLLFNKVAGLRPATLLEKRLWHMCFHVNFAKILKNTYFEQHL